MCSSDLLSQAVVLQRQHRYGKNALPVAGAVHPLKIFLRQFLNPLIYILLLAAAVSLTIGHIADAIFIGLVLVLNATIGGIQEYSAHHTAAALRHLVTHKAHVIRAGDTYEVDTQELVPGDIVLLETGDKIPADLRLLKT